MLIRFDNRQTPERCVTTQSGMVFACYTVTLLDSDTVNAQHVGTVHTAEAVDAWLQGETPESFVPIVEHEEPVNA